MKGVLLIFYNTLQLIANNMSNEKTIELIKGRIMDEYRKHPDLDWAEIAAKKIYSQWNAFYEATIEEAKVAHNMEIQSLQSERDRLREALEKITKTPKDTAAYHYATQALIKN